MGVELSITPPVASLRVGCVVAERYQILGVLSYGAMGIIYRARHLSLGVDVALKALRPELAGEGQYYRRFAEEAKNAASLKSEHVARVFDFGKLPSGEPFLAMELLDGQDLAEILSATGSLPVHLVLQIALQACEALGEAHEKGIVHRDLKPENLFLTRAANGEPRLKILDFGISKRLGGGGRHATMTGTVGSPHYMAPEQLRAAKDVDHRVDVWSLGVVLYELLAGAPAFDGETVAQVCTQVLMHRPPPLAQVRPEVGAQLSRVVERCLEVDRDQRFASVTQLAYALEGARGPEITALEFLDDDAVTEVVGVRRRSFARVAAALAATTVLAALAAVVVHIGPRTSLERVRSAAAARLVEPRRAERVAQVRVEQARAIQRPPPAPPEPPPPPRPRVIVVTRAAPRPPPVPPEPPVAELASTEAAPVSPPRAAPSTQMTQRVQGEL